MRALRLTGSLVVRATIFAILLIGSQLQGVLPTAADDGQSELILQNLPAKDSPEYQALRNLASDPAVEYLVMTKSEVWTVPTSRLDSLLKAAAEKGVSITRLDQNWNRMLSPYDTAPVLTPAQEDLKHKTMESKAAVGGGMMALPNAAVLEHALTKDMHAERPDLPPATLFLPFKDGTLVTARRTSISRTEDGNGYVWHGVTVDSAEPVCLLWWPDGRLTGTITHAGHKFVVKPMGGNMSGVVDMAPKMLPPEHQPMSPDMMQKLNMHEDPLVKQGDASMVHRDQGSGNDADRLRRGEMKNREDAPLSKDARAGEGLPPIIGNPEGAAKPEVITVTLIVAYTKQAASHYNDIEKDLIALAVEDTNQSFRNSGIDNVRVKLVHAYMTDYVESGTHFDHLFRFVYDNDGYMDEIHNLRRQYHANIAILVVHDPNGCGLSAEVAPSADKAFAVVHHECAALSYSIAHEIGHIFGARHDLGVDDTMTPFPFGHGFISAKNVWRDVMSYEESCGGCPRLPIWSNPDVLINGVPEGDVLRDNAKVIRERAAVVARFR